MKKIFPILILFSSTAMTKTYKKNIDNLSDMQKRVTQNGETEEPFNNQYWDNKEEGIYVDVATGEPLFSSRDKYDSGSGWPSFTKPIDAKLVEEKKDDSYGMMRVEAKAKNSNSHLGHVFDDGPKEKGGMRYCINSASLKFIAKKDLKKEGYEEYLKLFD